MAESKFFHFTFGPVQGFVAQARRTRDFWAGSFLLSWLAGVAMAEVKRQGGEISFPVPPENYLQWITEGRGPGEPPRQGAIPNRFKAYSALVPADFDGGLVERCIREAWMALAEHVWVQDRVADVATEHTRAIWERQNAEFWDISWVVTTDDKDASVMDQRKNWRTHFAQQAEPGVKCMVMEGWQELSGSVRPGQAVARFWQDMRHGFETDLAEGEALCGIAYVKRRFVRHFESLSASLSSGLRVHGWPLSAGMPSVSYMAAVHWLEALVQDASDDDVQRLLAAAKRVSPGRDEWNTRIACLQRAAGNWGADNPRRQLLALDGNLFFQHVHDNPRAYDYDVAATRALAQALARTKANAPQGRDPLSPFYAMVLMDGDSLGSHMANKDKQPLISTSLDAFTQRVPALVESHNGFLIYAGGDDVLAVLPLEDALGCAAAVRECYLACFRDSGIPTTISAAISFAHVKMPLGKVLADAHSLLDDVAKDGAGRDALAVRVWKPGGLHLEWAQPWEVALDKERKHKTVLETLADGFRQCADDVDAQFSTKFFFKIAQQFALLNPPSGSETALLSEDQATALLAVDFVCSADNASKVDIARAQELIAPLLRQCRRVVRDAAVTDVSAWKRDSRLEADAALLMRFLAEKGGAQ